MKASLGASKQKMAILAFLILGLAGCGGGTSGGGLPVGSTTGGGSGSTGGAGNPNSNPAVYIQITQPLQNAIVDVGGGSYSMKMSAQVTDAEGNPVADGTQVNLFVIDSIKARGVIGGGDTISGSTLSAPGAVLGGVDSTLFQDVTTHLDQAYVYRTSLSRIQTGANADHIILVNADPADMARVVASAPTATTISVGTSYLHNYPNADYANTEYFIGSSQLASFVGGNDGTNDTPGYAVTKGGIANFTMTYPAVDWLNVGCAADTDMRSDPYMPANGITTNLTGNYWTGGVYVVATLANNIAVSAIKPTCFNPIADGTITVIGSSTIGYSATPIPVNLVVKDGGQKIPIPYEKVIVAFDTSGGNATTSDYSVDSKGNKYYVTDANGNLTANITVANTPTTSAKVVFTSAVDPTATATVNVTVP